MMNNNNGTSKAEPSVFIASFVKAIGVLVIIVGIIGAIMLGQTEGWLSTIVYIIVSLVTGSVLLSLAEIVKLLHEIANKNKK